MIPILGLAVGVVLGLLLDPSVPLWLQPYLPIAVVAALDAVFGGIRARFDGIFDAKVFVVSFVSNVVVAGVDVVLRPLAGPGRRALRPAHARNTCRRMAAALPKMRMPRTTTTAVDS